MVSSGGVVIDNSVSVGWFHSDQLTAYAQDVLHQLGRRSFRVPSHWLLEHANSLLLLERRKKMTRQQRVRAMEKQSNLRLVVEQAPEDVTEVMRHADDFQLTSYDAAYLVCALRLKMPLATQDKALRSAAQSLSLWFDPQTVSP